MLLVEASVPKVIIALKGPLNLSRVPRVLTTTPRERLINHFVLRAHQACSAWAQAIKNLMGHVMKVITVSLTACQPHLATEHHHLEAFQRQDPGTIPSVHQVNTITRRHNTSVLFVHLVPTVLILG
jgi:hypothetical protein